MLSRVLLLFFLVILIFLANGFINPIPERKADSSFKPIYGTSYSFEQAGWYGLNPRGTYIKLLDDFNFDWIRLPFFWDQMLTDGEFNKNFDDLKFAIGEAQKRDIKIIIALGAKTPYFPEYHWPKEIEKQVKFGQRITLDHPVAKDILDIDEKVVRELSVYDNIVYWQVENEPLIGNVNRWKIDPSLIAKEVETVRQADPKKRPIILNHAAVGFYDRSWQKLLPILSSGDVFAANAFFKTKGTDLFNFKILGREVHMLWPDHLVWPVQPWFVFSPDFKSMKTKAEEKGAKFWVLEMQAEPYIKKLDEADDPYLTFTAGDIEKGNNFLRSYRIESVGLWGANFWLYKEKSGDYSYTKAVKSIVE